MNQKELNEIRRRLSLDKNCIGKIYGCFVNDQKQVVLSFEESVAALPEAESEKYMSLLKKSLSGGLGRCLINIDFTNEQIMEGEEYKTLLKLYESALKDTEALASFFQKVIDTIDMNGQNYLILVACDKYDVPFKPTDGTDMDDASDSVFTYIMCSICPVKDSKSVLGYFAGENAFRSRNIGQVVAPPEVGFMFPTFDNRATNIYSTLYYSKDTSIIHDEFIDGFFKAQVPMSAGEQKETFDNVLTESLEESFDFDVVQSVHEQIRERIEEHKASKSVEPLDMTASEIGCILENSGVKQEQIEVFKEQCDEKFGQSTALNPSNIIDPKKFEVTTPQVKIKINPDYTYAVQTREIDGRTYILIPADEGVQVNGVDIKI